MRINNKFSHSASVCDHSTLELPAGASSDEAHCQRPRNGGMHGLEDGHGSSPEQNNVNLFLSVIRHHNLNQNTSIERISF